MRAYAFAKRNALEIIRDPLSVFFGIGFPVVLLLLLSAIQANIPVDMFEISHLTPGISVFGLSFVSLFSATLISKDRGSAMSQRLYTTPMTPFDFIAGYTLPLLPLSLVQCAVCYAVAMLMGLKFSVNVVISLITVVPVCILYVAIGLLCGSVLNDKQVGGICGALLTNLSAWLSGIWFDLELVGGTFKKIANLLPFYHAVEMQRAVIRGDFSDILPHITWVSAYAVIIFIIATVLFLKQMKK